MFGQILPLTFINETDIEELKLKKEITVNGSYETANTTKSMNSKIVRTYYSTKNEKRLYNCYCGFLDCYLGACKPCNICLRYVNVINK